MSHQSHAIPVAGRARRVRERSPIERPPTPPPAGSTAVVYCEANFGASDGKTANGLVRYSEKYEILSVIDSEKAGLDAGEVLDGVAERDPDLRGLWPTRSRSRGAFPTSSSSGWRPPAACSRLSSAGSCSMPSRAG